MSHWSWIALVFLLGVVVGRMFKRERHEVDEPLLRSRPGSFRDAVYNPRGFRSRE